MAISSRMSKKAVTVSTFSDDTMSERNDEISRLWLSSGTIWLLTFSTMPRKYNEPLEERIEEQICHYLQSQGVIIKKINSEGFFDQKRWVYRKRKSPFSRPGISDLCGTIPPYGRVLWIEVKKPSEMKFFDRPSHIIEEDLLAATYDRWLWERTLKRYQHAVDQSRFIQNEIKNGGVAFYACDVAWVIKKLKDFDISVS